MEKVRIKQDGTSNSAYHRMGKPNWWVLVVDRYGNYFADIPRVRSDYELDVEIEIDPNAAEEIIIGCGKKGQCRKRDMVRRHILIEELLPEITE